MKTSASFLIAAMLLGLCGFAQTPIPQGVRHADEATRNNRLEPPPQFKHHIDPVQLQKQADQLAKLAQSIPADAGQINKGLLPKDTIDKLKQIEKLAKELRNQVAPP